MDAFGDPVATTEEPVKGKSSKGNAAVILDDDEYYKKWAGPILLGPFLPAIFALVVIVSGQLVLNTWTGTCGYDLGCELIILIMISTHLHLLFTDIISLY